MLKLALAALLIGAAAAAPPLLALDRSSPAPLCRVRAVAVAIPFPLLRAIGVRLRPGCPADGHAFIRLLSSSGATDPPNSYAELSALAPLVTYRGVFPNWHLEWEAESGKTYTVPEESGRGDGP